MKSFSDYLKDKEILNEAYTWVKPEGSKKFESDEDNRKTAVTVIRKLKENDKEYKEFMKLKDSGEDPSNEFPDIMKAIFVLSHNADIQINANNKKSQKDVGSANTKTQKEARDSLLNIGIEKPQGEKRYESLRLAKFGENLVGPKEESEFEISKDGLKVLNKKTGKEVDDKGIEHGEVIDKPKTTTDSNTNSNTDSESVDKDIKKVDGKGESEKETKTPEQKKSGDDSTLSQAKGILKNVNSVLDNKMDDYQGNDDNRFKESQKLSTNFNKETKDIMSNLTTYNGSEQKKDGTESQKLLLKMEFLERSYERKIKAIELRNRKERSERKKEDKADNKADKKLEKADKKAAKKDIFKTTKRSQALEKMKLKIADSSTKMKEKHQANKDEKASRVDVIAAKEAKELRKTDHKAKVAETQAKVAAGIKTSSESGGSRVSQTKIGQSLIQKKNGIANRINTMRKKIGGAAQSAATEDKPITEPKPVDQKAVNTPRAKEATKKVLTPKTKEQIEQEEKRKAAKQLKKQKSVDQNVQPIKKRRR